MHLCVLLSFHIISLFIIVSKSIHIEHSEDWISNNKHIIQ